MRLAIPLALAGNRRQGKQHVTQTQDAPGPLMPENLPLAMMKCLSVFRVPTGPVLPRPVEEDHDRPGQPFDAWERRGTLPGLGLRALFQRGDGHLGLRFP